MDSTTKKMSRMSYDQVKRDLDGFSKSSGFDLRGKSHQSGRTYVCYRDLDDPLSIVYITRIVKKKIINNDSSSSLDSDDEEEI